LQNNTGGKLIRTKPNIRHTSRNFYFIYFGEGGDEDFPQVQPLCQISSSICHHHRSSDYSHLQVKEPFKSELWAPKEVNSDGAIIRVTPSCSASGHFLILSRSEYQLHPNHLLQFSSHFVLGMPCSLDPYCLNQQPSNIFSGVEILL